MAVVIASYFICALGSTVATAGMVLSAWYFFVSDNEYRFYWGGGGVLLIVMGYLIYRLAYPQIQNRWDDYC